MYQSTPGIMLSRNTWGRP